VSKPKGAVWGDCECCVLFWCCVFPVCEVPSFVARKKRILAELEEAPARVLTDFFGLRVLCESFA